MRGLRVALMVLAIAACDDSSGPPVFEGMYTLRSYGQMGVPQRVATAPEGTYEVLASGSLEVRPGSMTMLLVTEFYNADNTLRSPPSTGRLELTYVRAGDNLTVRFAARETEFVGSVDGRWIVLDPFGQGKDYRFRK